MAKWVLGLVLAIFIAQGASIGGAAERVPACDQRQRVLGHLASKYKEATVAIGITNAGGLIEVLSTGDGESWTIIVSNPNGLTCLLATGEGWRAIQYRETELDPEA